MFHVWLSVCGVLLACRQKPGHDLVFANGQSSKLRENDPSRKQRFDEVTGSYEFLW